MKKIILFAAAMMMMLGCTDYEGKIDGYDFNGGVYIFNGLGDVGTLSVVDNQGVIINDAASLGSIPNNIIELDGILYIVNSGNNNVQMIDASTLQNKGSIELSALSNPMRAAISNRKLYATSTNGAGVDVYDFDKDSLYTIVITGVPDSCKNGGTDAIISYGTKVFVGVRNVKYDEFWNGIYGSEYIMLIDAANDSVYTTFEAGTNIADMLINDENELHVLSTGNRADIGGFVRVFDLNAINFDNYSQVDLGSQPGSFTLDGSGMVYVAVSGFNSDWTGFGGIMKYNSINNEIINGSDSFVYSSTESGILDICADDNGKVYAPLFDKNELIILESDTVKTVLTTGDGPQGLVFVKEEK